MDATGLPAFAAHPDVWLMFGALAAAYFVALARLGRRYATHGRPAATRLQITSLVAGIGVLVLVSTWPIHDVSEQHLFSVHMTQHLAEMLIAPPLILIGLPAWMARRLVPAGPVLTTVRFLARFVPAAILFNVALVGAHVPFVMDAQLRSEGVHFLVHVGVVVASLIAWLAVLSPLPEVPRLNPPLRMLFLFVLGIVPTVPASFLTFGDRPLYRVYEEFPRLYNISALDDMQMGGLIMKLAGGIILWVVIATIFFRWSSEEEHVHRPPALPGDLDRELAEMGPTDR